MNFNLGGCNIFIYIANKIFVFFKNLSREIHNFFAF